MSDKVIPIRPGVDAPEPEQRTPHPATISHLTDLLERARTGEIQAIAWAAVYVPDAPPGSSPAQETVFGFTGADGTRFSLNYGLDALHRQWQAATMDDDEGSAPWQDS